MTNSPSLTTAEVLAELTKTHETLRAMEKSIMAAQSAAMKAVLPPKLDMRLPPLPDLRMPPNPNLASEFVGRLRAWITSFDSELDAEHEVGIRLVSFGQTCVFHLTGLDFWDPSLVSFVGKTDEGNPVELIQHVTQISVLLLKMPRLDKSKPKEPFGFHPPPRATE